MHQTFTTLSILAVASLADAAAIEARSQSSTPLTPSPSATISGVDWFQTTPESYQGTTATGVAPFLAETNPAPFGQKTLSPNDPLETSEPIKGAAGRNIFHYMGNLSPYHVPDGFGVDEYPLPQGSNITQMHMIHRHGSRYPSSSEGLASWAQKIINSTASGNNFTGPLSFLNDWDYGLGLEILVPKGRQELYDSGVLNFYNYGHLFSSSSAHKLVARTTTQDRMLKSAENFLAGFFGLEWTEKANLLPIIEGVGYNNSLIGTYSCTRALEYMAYNATTPLSTWKNIYLKERTEALHTLTGSYNWTTTDSYNAQSMCAYETISYGYSHFCELFTFEEFENFSYSFDIEFSNMVGFACPAGRAQGIAWVEEFLARVEGHLLQTTGTNANMTLDTNPVTFPTDQNLYLDFSHDAGIVAVLTAFGFGQFAQYLPPTGPPLYQQFKASNIVPFGGRTNIEIIKTPHKVAATRPAGDQTNAYVDGTGETFYVHFLQNQRTLPLHSSFAECEYRDDGWCELSTFMNVQKRSLERSQFEYACFGNWTVTEYGTVTDGVPV
ncbi:hypothetical protein ASPFODRAFT_209421 [Aspergillus luchuensis CBS 106.47]|uniref:3-phytase n=1 Tax=Aspergillus luchuensis (strain CBS 106.47) TaxID=1137211 RepID=A0A1M3TAA5_ASPLC|nr:hypothetical protein ASPFODRAFT_209421 [Aspergillus luchuensis CBS 106.47]